MQRLLAMVVALGACEPSLPSKPDPEDTAPDCPSWYRDNDLDGYGDASRGSAASCAPLDGYAEQEGDCDDVDAERYPGATERCDGADDDCDGAVDEDAVDATEWYPDADGDRYGDGSLGAASCDPPTGWIADGTDCDDADPSVFPGGYEHCGGGDEDCDGEVDEDDAVDGDTWFADADGDGHGDPYVYTRACTVPDGYVADHADCDDADPTVSPDGTEACGGADEDCDGEVDEGDATDAPTWYADTDGDGYGDPASATLACTAPDGYVADGSDCDDADATVSPAPTWYADADGDGYGDPASSLAACEAPEGFVADATDCDDADATVNPAAAERCGGADEDCDGMVDEDDAADAPTWYADADGDGFGDPAASAVSCTAPAGSVADGTDCDDADAGISPSSPETCASPADDDCDGSVDEDDAIDAPTWYADADVDGRGDPTSTVTACTRPHGYLADDTDCDDTDASAHPGGTETCADPADEDCDGDADEVGTPDCSDWYADVDVDGYGDASDAECRCAASAPHVATDSGDCDDADASVSPDGIEVWADGVDQDCDGYADRGALSASEIRLWGEMPYDGAGFSVGGGDLDGDGLGDVVVGAPGSDRYRISAGAVYVAYGAVASVALGASGLVIEGEATADALGADVAVGDADGDGVLDLVVVASGADGGVGTAWLLLAPDTATTLADAAGEIRGTSWRYPLGAVAFLGDVDADGDEDVAVVGQAVDIFSGFPLGSAAMSDADTVLTPGDAVLGPGDVDGDGVDDLVTGDADASDGTSSTGAAYVFLGPVPSGVSDPGSLADATLFGLATSSETGRSLAAAGDVDGDGLPDLLVGAPGTVGGQRAFVVADVANTTSFGDAYVTIETSLTTGLGDAMAGDVDLDGDGSVDLAVTETFVTASSLGAVHLFLGPLASGTYGPSDAAITLQGDAGSSAGNDVAGVTDTDGDGLDDVLVGADYDGRGGHWSGAAWLVSGP